MVFIITSYSIVYLMKFKNPVCRTYDAASDNFKLYFVLVPCAILGCIWNVKFTPFEILWAFSVYLEVNIPSTAYVVTHTHIYT